MSLSRRSFLQSLALVPGFWSLLPTWGRSYQRLLAQTTPRKLALLVGINAYPDHPGLQGCLTDLELQRDLLIHRFGFAPQDIVLLQDQQATLDGMELAFLSHLSDQTQAGDVVLFHFSGLGSQFPIIQGETVRWVNSLIPWDGLKGDRCLWERTLRLLAQSLATEKVSLVLDTSYRHAPPPPLVHLPWRSHFLPPAIAQPEAVAFESQMRFRLQATQGFKGLKPRQSFPGTVLRAARTGEGAREWIGDRLRAGLFTYHLTQYLWETTPPSHVYVTMRSAARPVKNLTEGEQRPTLQNTSQTSLYTYFLPPQNAGQSAILLPPDSNRSEQPARLLGIAPLLLVQNPLQSCFVTVEGEGVWQLKSREGLQGWGTWIAPPSSPAAGLGLVEQVRSLSRKLGLIIALCHDLDRIERVDATSALAGQPLVQGVINGGEGYADLLLQRLPGGGYGCLAPGGRPWLSLQAQGSLSKAIGILLGRWSSHLAAKGWQLLINGDLSGIPLRITLEQIMGETVQPLGQWLSGQQQPRIAVQHPESVPAIAPATLLRYRVDHLGEGELGLYLWGLGPEGQSFGLPPQKLTPDQAIFWPLPHAPAPGRYTWYVLAIVGDLPEPLAGDPWEQWQQIAQAIHDRSLPHCQHLGIGGDRYGLHHHHWLCVAMDYDVL